HALPLEQLRTTPLAFALSVAKILGMAMLSDFSIYFNTRFTQTWLPSHLPGTPEIFDTLAACLAVGCLLMNIALCIFCTGMLACAVWRVARKEAPLAGQHLRAGAATLSLLGAMALPGTGRFFYLSLLELPLLYMTAMLWLATLPETLRSVHAKTVLLQATAA